jgi:transcriptional regulator with XRE-family HTH domain
MSHHRNWSKLTKGWTTATKPPKQQTLLGTAIRDWCMRTGISQTKLAAKLDVEHTYISRLASGERMPSRELAFRIADELGIDHADMALMLCEIDPNALRKEIEKAARGSVIASINKALDRFP